jgi:CheY-like chemotaxis protein
MPVLCLAHWRPGCYFQPVGWRAEVRPGEGSLLLERVSRDDATALVVDDDVVLRSTLAELLTEEGFVNVIQASNGFSGLRLAMEHHPKLIFLDLVMPELSGGDVLRELRSAPSARDMAIVVISGSPERLTEGQMADVDGVLRKPFDIEALLVTVSRAIQRAANRATEVPPVAPAAPVPSHGRSPRTRLSGAARRRPV